MNLFLPRLRELLAESGKMQKDICDELGISKQKLSNWKTGYSEPNFDDIIMLAKYFDVSSDYPASTRNDRNKRKSFLIRLTSFLREDC